MSILEASAPRDQPIQAAEQLRWKRHIADAAALAEDAPVCLTARANNVARPQPGQLVKTHPAVSEDPDDELVPLFSHGRLHALDLCW